MAIDTSAVGFTADPVETSWTSSDALLYALGVGAGTLDATELELEFTTENSDGIVQRVLPTFGIVLGGMSAIAAEVGSIDPAMVVHGEQAITLHREIPIEGTLRSTSWISAIYDKGSGAVVIIDAESVDAGRGDPLFTTRSAVFVRGAGGFGGDRGPRSSATGMPRRAPDHSVTCATRDDQALLYRLSGDRNPLHSDPKYARSAGFAKPILHGLCTYGFTGRALLHALCGSDPSRFRAMSGRFVKAVFPGETLVVKMWVTSAGEARFQTENGAGETVLGQGTVSFD